MEKKFFLITSPVDTEDIVQKIKTMVIPKAEAKQLLCKIQLNDNFPKKFTCDLRRILQVILNLAFNSIKYTFRGEILIKFGISKKNSNLYIKVKDTGIGIPVEELMRINKLFGLVDRRLMKCETGVGLGLTVSRSIIEAMNGDLTIASSAGVGTVCKVSFPNNDQVYFSNYYRLKKIL